VSHPFFFGPVARQLFGVYHAPLAPTPTPAAVVLCPPFGQEYMRTHRALRQLAVQLAMAGHHVLRFDYSGTGDSAGDGAAVTIDAWLEDVETAIDEIRDTTGITDVALIGLRIGAMLAATTARRRTDVTKLVLWDPVVSWRLYLESLLALAKRQPPGDDTLSVEGYPLPSSLCRPDLLPDIGAPPAQVATVGLVVSEQRPEFEALRQHLPAAAGRSWFAFVDTPARWDHVDSFGAVLFPRAIVRIIVDSFRRTGE
jgi:pimeloyl-ACP methyl ester carboxylesterase